MLARSAIPCHRHQPCPHRTPALVCAHTRTRVGAGAMKKALCTTSTSLGAGTATTTPAHVHLAQSPATLCPQVQLAHCRLSPTPSRTFRGVPTPISCPGLSACLDLLAEGAHHKRNRDRPRAGPKPRREEPIPGQTRWKLTQSRLGSPQTPVTTSLTPRAPARSHPASLDSQGQRRSAAKGSGANLRERVCWGRGLGAGPTHPSSQRGCVRC